MSATNPNPSNLQEQTADAAPGEITSSEATTPKDQGQQD